MILEEETTVCLFEHAAASMPPRLEPRSMQWRVGASEVAELNRHRLSLVLFPLNYVALVPQLHFGLCDVRKHLSNSSWLAPLEAAQSAHISLL